jgi:putative alpha-1,2-mannosidase
MAPTRSLFRILPVMAAAIALPATAADKAPVDVVDTFVGSSGDHGQLTPAASAPYGMIELAPDTQPATHAGYDFDATTLIGFSHTRAVGVGCHGAGGDLRVSVGYEGDTASWPVDKASERAGPGWYHVRYGTRPIDADLAAGANYGISRFTVTQGGRVVVTIDPSRGYAKRYPAQWAAAHDGALTGTMTGGTVCSRGIYHLHFAARLLHNGVAVPGTPVPDGDQTIRYTLDVHKGDTITLRTALSTVSPEDAGRTLDTTLGTASIDTVRAQTREAWNALLSRVQVTAPADIRSLFYSMLYRTFQTPVRIDAFGTARRSDGAAVSVADGHHFYSQWSLWDNYRTQIPLVALLDPASGSDIATSLAALYQAGEAQWATLTEPFITVRTEHAGIALLDLYRKHIGGFDPAATLPLIAANVDKAPAVAPDELIEKAYDQWAVAELADDLGDKAVAQDFRRKSLSYRTMWLTTFRDLGVDADVVKAHGLYQGTLWQYRWAPVFDLDWLQHEALGDARFDRELAHFFDASLYNMTNEPDIQVPFLFARTRDPARMDRLVARLRTDPVPQPYTNEGKVDPVQVERSFALSPVGFATGMDDDQGAMASWYIWASLGLYPLTPGKPDYVITAPGVAHATIDVGNGKTFTIERIGPATAKIVKAITLNSRAVEGRIISHDAIVAGGTMRIVVGN